jgi:exonuclease SbcC
VLLQTIFPVQRHRELMDAAKERTKAVAERIAGLEAQVKEVDGVWMDADFLREEAALALAAREMEPRVAEAEQARDLRARALLEGQQLAGFLDARARLLAETETHKATAAEQVERGARLDAARRAEGAMAAIGARATLAEDLERLLRQLQEAEVDASRCRERWEALEPKLEAIPAREAKLREVREEVQALRQRAADLAALGAARRSAEQARNAEEEVGRAVGAARERVLAAEREVAAHEALSLERDALREPLAAARAGLGRCQQAEPEARRVELWLQEEQPRCETRRREAGSRLLEARQDEERAASALTALRRAVDADAARVVAAGLVPGEPCPACGSTEHPRPASQEIDGRNLRALLEERARGAEQATKARQAREAALAAEEAVGATKLEQATDAARRLSEGGWPDVLAWRAALESARGGLQPLEVRDRELERALLPRSANQQRLAAARAEAERGEGALRAAAERRAGAEAQLLGVGARVGPVGDLEADLRATSTRIEERDRDIEKVERNIAEIRQQGAEAQAKLAAAESAARSKRDERMHKEALVPAAEAALQEALARGGFADADAARAARIGERARQDLEAASGRWVERSSQLRGQFESVERSIDGREAPDLAALQEGATASSFAFRTAAQALAGALESLESHRKRMARRTELRALIDREAHDHRAMIELSRHLHGEGAGRVDFPTWILSWWLDRVLARASERIRALSLDRYQFRLRPENPDGRKNAGLDIEILDAWSASVRDVKALSGGEKFLASLALALGLADVVQSRSGGVQLDTLFIDEGFGSLDANTLDGAMALIEEISHHRSVGLISHVEAMQRSIPSQIRVTKGVRGSTARVVTGRAGEP